jgi:hypothetical protein
MTAVIARGLPAAKMIIAEIRKRKIWSKKPSKLINI